MRPLSLNPVMASEEEGAADTQSNTELDPPFLYDAMVTVLVGSQETRFDLHRGLLCASSDFFKAVITGDFKERAQNEIKLPEQDVKIFRFFVHWLYTGRLRGFYYPKTTKPSIEELRQAAITELESQDLDVLEELALNNPYGKALYMANYRDAPFSHLVGLYILADTFLVHDLKDPIITLIIDVYCWSQPVQVAGDEDDASGSQRNEKEADDTEAAPSKSEPDDTWEYTTLFWSLERPPGLEDPCQGINMAWKVLPRNSPLCQLTVECFCDNVGLVEEHTNGRQYHPDFLAAIAHTYALRLGRLDKTFGSPDWDQKGQICKFHEHSAESQCLFAKRDTLRREAAGRLG